MPHLTPRSITVTQVPPTLDITRDISIIPNSTNLKFSSKAATMGRGGYNGAVIAFVADDEGRGGYNGQVVLAAAYEGRGGYNGQSVAGDHDSRSDERGEGN